MDWKRIGICSTLVMTVCTEVFGATNETQESNQQMIQQIRESVNDDGFREPNYFFYDIACNILCARNKTVAWTGRRKRIV